MVTTLEFDESMDGYLAPGQTNPAVGYEAGRAANARVGVELTIRVDDLGRFLEDARHQAQVSGRITGSVYPGEPVITSGSFNLFTLGPGGSRRMEYALAFESGGRRYRLLGEKKIQDDPLAFDAVDDLTTLFTRIVDDDGTAVAAGILRFRLARLPELVRSVRVQGTNDPMRARARFLRFFLSEEVGVLLRGWKDLDVGAARRRSLVRPRAELAARYDVVIVGTGYGGGVLAARLTAAAARPAAGGGAPRRVCVLERGTEWRAGDFPDEPWELPAAMRTRTNPTGLLDYQLNDDVDVLVGNGVGGTSLINANVMIQPEAGVFRLPGWPRGLPDLGPYFARAREALHVRPHPSAPLKSAVFREAAAKGGAASSVELAEVAITFEARERPAERLHQEACTDCGGCVTGCNYAAKNTVDMTYLAVAETQGAEIHACLEVDSLEPLPGGGYRVHCLDHSASRPSGEGHDRERAGRCTIDATEVVLAAGALGSFGILARSARQHGLAVSPALGQRFSGNGDVLGFAYNTDVRTQPDVGPTITSVARFAGGPELVDHFVIEEGGVPRALMAVLRGMVPILRATGVDTDEGWVDGLREWLRMQADRVGLESRGAMSQSLVFLGMGFESRLGQLALDAQGRVRVRWPEVAEQPFARAIDEQMEALTARLGGTYIKNPRAREFLGRNLITVHPLGGCPMGEDAASGVVNHRGEVFGHEHGLYVADGSILPGPVGVNPALTIAAVSEWIAEGILSRWQAAGTAS